MGGEVWYLPLIINLKPHPPNLIPQPQIPLAVFWLDEDDLSFPPPEEADEDGLLAVSADLRPERVLEAYRSGVFPWFEDDGYFFWFSPDPRAVLFPADLKVHKSMRSIFNQQKFTYTFNQQFESVMEACAATPRHGQSGTWITPAFVDAYVRLHQMGYARSVEVWESDRLVGGLYGILIGKVFFGESMFSTVPNASKAGFIRFVQELERKGVAMIDCQQDTEHLQSLGSRAISRLDFLQLLERHGIVPT
jgi:leucyl/phenylalanyl-tRNA--protein transferase